MRTLIQTVLLLLIVITTNALAADAAVAGLGCKDQRAGDKVSVFDEGCLNGLNYRIYYNKKTTSIVVKNKNKEVTLQKIPKRYDPVIVGADTFIGFLPDKLQVYKDIGILAYISSIRTSGGDGKGQCGAGAEIFLNFLNIQHRMAPKVLSKILIGSCSESIEIMDQDLSSGILGRLFVIDKKLSLQFMNYPEIEGYPTASISTDLKHLEFKSER
ncbi:hypothetical protein [Massilia suwonensis]|uniref:Uncharacterized protein n=1 Tax=Massilia suwonensis TaxID=648895 RepID=A0ABW0MNU7_9BURK